MRALGKSKRKEPERKLLGLVCHSYKIDAGFQRERKAKRTHKCECAICMQAQPAGGEKGI